MTLLLIDKQDNFELIRDRIAVLLKVESLRQVGLAETAALDNSSDWDFRVYTERTNPWNEFIDGKDDQPPIVNVWFDTASPQKDSSNIADRQKWNGTFNVDCFGYGVAQSTLEGHEPGDQKGALVGQRVMRFCRNILMAQENTYLGYPSEPQRFVWSRWVSSMTSFQPTLDENQANQITGCRLVLQVEYNETAPEHEDFETIDFVSIDVDNESGEVIAETDFDYSIP